MEAAFHIGSIPIYGRVFLSPMANFSDSPYRKICRRFGAAFSFCEFVPAETIAVRDPEYLSMLRFEQEERPLIFQLFGNNCDTLAEAALVAMEFKPDVIDLNMGCSVQQIAGNGSGAALLRTPLLAGQMIERLRKTVPVPITAKIRLGWDNSSRNYLEVAHILQESGAAMLSVHGRTKAQAYTGTADWNAIAEVKANARVPVLGVGDVLNHADGLDRIRKWGVDGVLIGRNAAGNPWVFKGMDRSLVPPEEILGVMLEHFRDMLRFYGERGCILFRKHAARYVRGFEGADDLRAKLLQAATPEDFETNVMRFIANATAPIP